MPARAATDQTSVDTHRPSAAVPATAAGAVRLGPEPPDTDACLAALLGSAGGRAGAAVTFTGVVRADRFVPEGGETEVTVDALDFETFAEMAVDELERIRREGVQRFALEGLSIVHRTGTLRVGDPIVLVAAASAHRAAAFEAAAWTMDELKRRVPLWKRERSADGRGRWVPADACACIDH